MTNASAAVRTPGPQPSGPGVRIDVEGLRRVVRGGHVILDGVSLSVLPGELVAIVGGSGAGKTTLLTAMAGTAPPDSGTVRLDGVDLYAHLPALRTVLGFVPQDDIIHTDLTLERTLRYAAQLRLAPDTPRAALDAAITRALAALELTDRADVRVGALSGGQRKRASVAAELLTDPRVFFLDEPTSGLDPATGAELLRVLRGLTASGTTVVFTTHAVQDLRLCDRVVVLAAGGRLAFTGTPDEAKAHFGVDEFEGIYERLAGAADDWVQRASGDQAPTSLGTPAVSAPPVSDGAPVARPMPGPLRQFRVVTARTFETLSRNRLTMAILLGSPAMVVAMFAILFRPGAFDPASPSPSAIMMIVFWVTFGTFFFGVTYGLLQICTERPIVEREHAVGLRLGPYLLAKLAVLLPFLLLVNVVMLAVLRLLDRLPAADLTTYLSVGTTLALLGAASLALGLLVSAAVGNPSQATLALPMLCFPAVLFSGAILPVHLMAPVGSAISVAMPERWAFEAVGHDLGVRGLLLAGGSPLGPPLVASYGSAGQHATGVYWLILSAFTVALLLAAWGTLVAVTGRDVRRARRAQAPGPQAG